MIFDGLSSPTVSGLCDSGAMEGTVGKEEPAWVTKTNVTDYERCPRAYWLVANGLITREEMFANETRVRLDAGVEFERRVVTNARPAEADGFALSVDGRPRLLLGTGMFVNESRGLRGEPDGVETGTGSWAPIEIKDHLKVSRLDKIELAFYWLLLEPYRTDRTATPHGYVQLRGAEQAERVELRAQLFRTVDRSIGAVRQTRSGPEPRPCRGCYVCLVTHPPDPARFPKEEDLTRLHDIGPARARQLELIDVRTPTDLLSVGTDEILERKKGRGWRFGRSHIDGWIAHAQALEAGKSVLYGVPLRLPSQFIAFDLEYLQPPDGDEIWLAGMLTSSGELTQFWSRKSSKEHELVQSLAEYWDSRPDAMMVTWSGKSADLPALRRAAQRTGIDCVPDPERHFDLRYWAVQNLRIPTNSFELKDVAPYFGLLRTEHDIQEGRAAARLYSEARRSWNPWTRHRTRARLERYNQDDLRAVVGMVEVFRQLTGRL